MTKMLQALIIEDSVDDFYLLKSALESSREIGFRIFHADRLDNAFTIAEEESIDVAILDLSLPDSFGLDTFLSFHEREPFLPVVIMTGYRDQEMALEAVQKGAQDYLHKGEASVTAIVRTIRYAIERQRLITELKTALEHIKVLQGLLPICAICKNIRDDKGYWNGIESYLSEHSELEFSHSICPDCAEKHYPEFYKKNEGKI